MGGNGAREERPHALYSRIAERAHADPRPAAAASGRPGPTSFHDRSHRVRSRPRVASVVLTPSWKSAVDQWLAQLGATSIHCRTARRCRCCSDHPGMRVRERSNLPRGIRSVVGWIDSRRLASEASSETRLLSRVQSLSFERRKPPLGAAFLVFHPPTRQNTFRERLQNTTSLDGSLNLFYE